MKALLVYIMRMMLACCLVTVPSLPPSFSVPSSQSRSFNWYQILVRDQPIIFEDWYRKSAKSAIARLLKIDSFLSRLSK